MWIFNDFPDQKKCHTADGCLFRFATLADGINTVYALTFDAITPAKRNAISWQEYFNSLKYSLGDLGDRDSLGPDQLLSFF